MKDLLPIECVNTAADLDMISTIAFDLEKFRLFQLSRSSMNMYFASIGIVLVFIAYAVWCFRQVEYSNIKILLYSFSACVIFCGWNVCLIKYLITTDGMHRKEYIHLRSMTSWFNHKFLEKNKNILIETMWILEDMYIISITILGGLILVYRCQYGPCGNLSPMIQVFICNGEHSSEYIPSEIAVMTLIVSLTSKILLKGSRYKAPWISLAVGMCFVFYAIYITKFWKSLWLPILMVPFIVLSMGELSRQNVESFQLHESLHQSLEDNEKMAEELRLNEMKMMIGNVAHDLKTVCKT
jgi:hypothetical protein